MFKDIPIVSVIVPVYNNVLYIKACLDSILAQKIVGEFEVICVNDGSIDGSGNIINRFAEKYRNIRVIHKENAGLSSARNVGLDNAQGKYVIFVDGDDRLGGPKGYEGDEIQSLITPMKDGVQLVIGNLSVVYEANEYMREADEKYYKLPFIGRYDIKPVDLGKIHVSSCSKCFDREIIEKYNLRFPQGLHFEDAYWCSCYSAVAPKSFGIKKDIYTYFRHNNGIMNSVFNDGNTELAWQHSLIAEKVYDFYKENNLLSKKGMNEWIVEMFESFCNFSRWHCKPSDELLIMAHMGELLRKNDIDCGQSVFLRGMKEGKISAFREYLDGDNVFRTEKFGLLQKIKFILKGKCF